MFEKLRHYESTEEYTYPRQCGPYKIEKIRDLTVGLIVDFKKNGEKSKPVNLFFHHFHFIKFDFIIDYQLYKDY